MLDIVALPAADHDTITSEIARLSMLPLPNEGDSIDGFRLDALVSDGRYTRLFRGVDTVTGQTVAVKFPKPRILSDHGARLASARETLVGSRAVGPFVGGARCPPIARPGYTVCSPGMTARRWRPG